MGNHRGLLAKFGILALALLLIATVFVAPSVRAEDQVCSFAIDFGDGRVEWADVPVEKGMNGFDVFLNATEMLQLSEMHSDTPPYGHTVQRVENYSMQYDFANPAASGKVWHLWYWDSAKGEWSVSNTLLDGIDATTTPAILLIYLQDPSPPPTLPLEHKSTVTDHPADKLAPTNESANKSANKSTNKSSPEAPTMTRENISMVTSNFNYEVNDRNVTFEASSSNESVVSNYTWSFGDGSTAEGRSVEHNYSTDGNFSVILTASNETGGEKNVSQIVRLESGEPKPIEATQGSEQAKSEGFPIWVWGVLTLVLIVGVEAVFLYRKKRK